MAITIQATPATYSSAQDDLIYTVAEVAKTADPVTYPNYKFIADVYVGATLVARIKKVPNPVTRIGIFNIGQVVRNYLATVFNPGPGLVCQALGNGVFNVGIQVKFGEEYSYTAYTNLVLDSVRTYFNNYNTRLIGATSSLVALQNKIASSSPLMGQVLLSSGFYFAPYFPTTTAAVTVTVTPVGGGLTYTTTITPANALDLQLLNISPTALNALQAGTITAATLYYTVAIGGQQYRLDLICEPVYDVYTLHFLNKYGGFESKVFNKVSRKTIDITKKDYGRLPYNVDSSGFVTYKNANNVYNESRATYSSQYKEKLALNSDLLTDGEYKWLQELILSPLIYIEDSGYFYPVVITDNNYEAKRNVNDLLTNLAINVEYGIQQNAQFR